MENCLKFGDLIILQYNSKQNIAEKRYQQSMNEIPMNKEGFLSATGFIDKNIYFQEVRAFERIREAFTNFKKELPNMINYRDFVFQICPKLNYEFHKEYEKSIKFYKKLQKIKKLTERQKQLKENLAMKLSKLSERIQKEKEQNILIQKDHEKKHITYGSEIFLMHHDSQSFINAKNDSAQTNKIGYDCYLSDWYSRAMIFKIQPKYKSRQDGEVIQYGDNVIFQNLKYNTYLSFTEDLKAEHDKYIEELENNPYRMPQNIIDPLTDRFRSYLSQDTETAWQINLFRHLTKDNYIKGCDMIRLKHTELNGHLSADLDYTDKTDVYVRQYEGEFDEEKFSINSIWEIERNELEVRGERFERKEKKDGRKQKIAIYFRLKHFSTGRLLNTSEEDEIYLSKNSSNLDEVVPYTVFRSNPILKNLDFLQPEFSYYLMDKHDLYLCHNKEKLLERKSVLEKFKGHEEQVSKIYTPLEDKDFETTRWSLGFQEKFSSEDAFTIKRVPISIQNEILFVRSALPKLKNISYIFKNKLEEDLNSELYLQIESIFEEICFFLYNIDSKKEIDIFQQEEDPILRRQKILKDMKFIDIFIDIIYLPFKSNLFQLERITQQDMITHMLAKCYSTLRFTIQEYRPNELYCSQWLNLIMKQCLETRKYNDIQAGVTFQELIDNNKRILESRIETSTMEKFIEFLMQENKLSNYVEIIRAICICNEKPMIKNQKELSRLILDDEAVRENLIFKLKTGENEVTQGSEVHIRPMFQKKWEWMSLEDFRKRSILEEDGKTYHYFISMTLLLSDLCMDKNYLAVDKLRHLYPLNITYQIFTGENYPPELREAFCKILEHLWINIHPYNEIKIPQHVIVYEKISKNIEVCASTENVDAYKTTKDFIAKHLDSCFKPVSYANKYSLSNIIEREDFDKMEEVTESKKDIQLRFDKFNYAVLSLCEEMFTLGFYNTLKELNTIVQCLKGNLSQFLLNSARKARHKTKRSGFENNDLIEEESQIIINCKKKICRILLIILEIKLDLSIKQFLLNLKSLNVITKKGKTLIEDSSKQRLIQKNSSFSDIDSVIDNFKLNKKNVQNLVKIVKSEKAINLDKDSRFISYMLNLINSNNEGLKKLSLKILNKLYSQKKDLGDHLKSILTILTKKDLTTWNSVIEKSKELRTLCENCELWYSDKKTVEYEKVEMIIKDFESEWTKSKAKSRASLMNFSDDGEMEEKTDIVKVYINKLSEKDHHHGNFLQHLFREAGIFSSLFELLNYDLEMGRCYNSPHNIRLITMIFHLLAEMTYNNKKNKILVTQLALKNIIIPYLLNEKNDFHAYFVIKELVKSNSVLVNDLDQMEILINFIFEKIRNYKFNDIRKSLCMDILSYIIIDHGEIHKFNQNLIIKKLFNKQDGTILPQEGFLEALKKDSKTQISISENKILEGSSYIETSNMMHYFCTILRVLAACGDGKSAYAENVGQNYIKTEQVYEFLNVKNMNIVVRYNVYNFYYHIYIDTEKLLASFKVTRTTDIWKMMTKEFVELSNEKSSMRLGIVGNRFFRISGTIQGTVLFKEYLKILMRSILGLTKKAVFQTIPDTVSGLREVHSAGKRIIKNYAELTQYFITFNSEIGSLLASSKNKTSTNTDFEEITEKDKRNDSDDLVIPKMDLTQDPMYDSLHLTFSRKEIRLRKFLVKVTKSKFYKSICNQEFRALSNKIQNIESVTNQIGNSIKFKEFAKSLISYLDPNNEEFDPELTSVSLMIFTKFIDSVNESTDKKSSEWDVSNFTDCKRSLKRRQDSLIELKIVDFLCEIIKGNTTDELKLQALELSISLLIGGNEVCQGVFHDNMVKDQENLILLKLKKILDESFDQIKKKMSEDNDREFKNKIQVSKKLTMRVKLERKKKEDFRLKKHIEICTKIYRFLQLLCEGHNITLQNFLRIQKSDSSSLTSNNINFISDTAFKFGSLIKLINEKLSSLISQILDFLIDSVQGPCLKNQNQLFRSKMTDFVKDMMNDMFFDVTKIEDLSELEGEKEILNSVIKKGIKLVISLFEGNDGKRYARYLSTNMEFSILINKLSEELIRYYKNNYNLSLNMIKTANVDFLNKKLNCLTFDEEMSDAFDIYFFINILDSMTGCYKEEIRDLNGIHELSYQFFEEHSAHIEIVFRGHLQRVYFIIHPACNYLSEKKKMDILDEVKRDTANDKLTDLMKEAPRLFDLVDHLTNLANGFLGISPKMFELIVNMSLVYSYGVNILIFSTLEKKIEGQHSQLNASFDSNHIVIKICGILFIVLGFLRLIVWGLIEGKLVLLDKWREDFKGFKKYLLNNLDHENETDHVVISYLSKNMIDISSKEKLKIIRHVNDKRGNGYTIPCIYYYTKSLIYLLDAGALRYIMFYIWGSVYAILTGDFIIYSLFLLEVVAKDPTLRDVIKAVTKNKKQLILTAMLGLFIIYIYSLFAYYFINDTFYMDSVGDNGENICTTVVHCFTTVVSLGPRSSGGIGDVLLRQSYMDGNETRYYIRFVYDVTCFIIINIIFMNIIFGIIIDTFAELRGAKNTKENDKKNICYICSLDRHKFENTSEGFEVHTTRDHKIWNYIYFVYSIKKKDSTEYNGMETYVSEMIENDDVNWFPLYRAMSIKDTSDSKDNIEKQVEDMMERVQKIQKKFQTN